MEQQVISEAELIEAAASGNTGAFSELVRLHRMRVLRVAFGVVGSVDEAEDVAQEVFIKVWHSLPQHTGSGSFTGWLYRITVNTAIDALRRRKGQVALDDVTLSAEAHTENTVLRIDTQERVRAAIQRLPQGARVTLILREYEQLSYKEIAAVLRIPMGTVMSRLNYARQALKKELEKGMEGL